VGQVTILLILTTIRGQARSYRFCAGLLLCVGQKTGGAHRRHAVSGAVVVEVSLLANAMCLRNDRA
jgi:hypothetical protein